MSQDFHLAYLAGAGTGKTYSLTHNYLHALFGLDPSGIKKRPSDIVALTFTDKAAHEMRLRITKLLTSLMLDHNDPETRELKKVAGDALPDTDEIRRILRALPYAQIATFHGFCAQLLRKEADAVGLDDRFTILTPLAMRNMARNIMRPIIIDEVRARNETIKSLVVRFRLGASFTSLGLIDNLLDVYERLFEKNLTTDKLQHIASSTSITHAQLMKDYDDIASALQSFRASPKATPTTLERLDAAREILPLLGAVLNHRDDEAAIVRTMKDLMRIVAGNFGAAEPRRALVGAIHRLGAHVIDYFVKPDELALIDVLQRFDQAFAQYKRESQALSYGDLLHLTKNALATNLHMRARVKQRIKHLLVDEYQDTSPIQQDILAFLLEDKQHEQALAPRENPFEQISFNHGPSLFVVGDQKQSIYGFRGANVQLFDDMLKKMAHTHRESGHFKKNLLTINRRSKKLIIDVVNLVARHTLVDQGYREEQALIACENNDQGRAALWVLKDDRDLDKTTANCYACAFGIGQLLQNRNDLVPQQIVVLTRRIKSASVIKAELLSLGIPARVIAGDGFFATQEIADILSALRLLYYPKDQLATAVVLRSPLVMLSDEDVLKIGLADEGLDFLHAVAMATNGELSGDAAERIMRFSQTLEKALHAITKDGLAHALDIIIDETDLAFYLGQTDRGAQSFANIDKLRTMISLSSSPPMASIDELYEQIFSASKEPEADGPIDDNAVVIMTIHQSKGLEFDVVVLADGESTLKTNTSDFFVDEHYGLALRPKGRPIAELAASKEHAYTRYDLMRKAQREREHEELARLLYVALTRAKQEIYIASSQASFGKPSVEQSLLGLFLRSYHLDPQQFLALVSIEHIERPTPLPMMVHDMQQNNAYAHLAPYVPAKNSPRFFASGLTLDENAASLLMPYIKEAQLLYRGVDGHVAHQLLSACGRIAFALEDLQPLEQLIESSLRALGLDPADHVMTKRAIMTTFTHLRAKFSHIERVIFEMPLSCDILDDAVIEGYADAVLIGRDAVHVIEFKSSRMQAISPSTYAQVLAYAHGLSARFDLPITFTVALFGSPNLTPQIYDTTVENIFLTMMNSYSA